MNVIRILIAILLSVFSTVVMSYIALAASIGPWIETTLVLISMFLFQIIARGISNTEYVQSVSLTTAAGGIGGILATGLAFSLPTLYFLSPTIFQSWLDNPLYFASVVSAFCLVAGSFGLLIATIFEERFLVKQQMKFPIGELVFNAIAAPGQMRKAIELASGFLGTQLLLFVYSMSSYAGRAFTLIQGFRWSVFTIPAIALPIDQLPMYCAVGFVTGHVIALPLIVGFFAKILCLDPLFYLYTHNDNVIHNLIFSSFANVHLNSTEFVLAFCSGMVLYGSCMGFFDLFKTALSFCRNGMNLLCKAGKFLCLSGQQIGTYTWVQTIMAIALASFFLRYYSFSIVQQLFLIGLIFLCTYALVLLGTQTGFVASWGMFPVVRMVRFQECCTRFNSFLHTALFQKQAEAVPWMQISLVLVGNISFLYYFSFTFIQQCYLIVFSAVCIYQMLIIAGRMGIIPLGRFATFVMIPGMFLFDFDYVQVTLVAAFVEIAGGVAGDVLFGRRLAALAKIEHEKIVRYQWLGLIICSLTIGILFWLFITTLGIGTEHGLPATKAASRALLIAFKSFDWYVLAFGFVFGSLIKYTKINPALLLGGILMPPTISLMLISGGLLTYLTKNKEFLYPVLSGVSAGNSIWMLGDTLVKILL